MTLVVVDDRRCGVPITTPGPPLSVIASRAGSEAGLHRSVVHRRRVGLVEHAAAVEPPQHLRRECVDLRVRDGRGVEDQRVKNSVGKAVLGPDLRPCRRTPRERGSREGCRDRTHAEDAPSYPHAAPSDSAIRGSTRAVSAKRRSAAALFLAVHRAVARRSARLRASLHAGCYAARAGVLGALLGGSRTGCQSGGKQRRSRERDRQNSDAHVSLPVRAGSIAPFAPARIFRTPVF